MERICKNCIITHQKDFDGTCIVNDEFNIPRVSEITENFSCNNYEYYLKCKKPKEVYCKNWKGFCFYSCEINAINFCKLENNSTNMCKEIDTSNFCKKCLHYGKIYLIRTFSCIDCSNNNFNHYKPKKRLIK